MYSCDSDSDCSYSTYSSYKSIDYSGQKHKCCCKKLMNKCHKKNKCGQTINVNVKPSHHKQQHKTYSVVGYQSIVANNNDNLMEGMTLNFKPINNKVFLHFSASGIFSTEEISRENGIVCLQFTIQYTTNDSPNINLINIVKVVPTYNLWNVAFNYPIDVTSCKEHVFSIYWKAIGYGNFINNPTQSFSHRNLIIVDQP